MTRVVHEAGQHIPRTTRGHAICERHEDHLVAAARPSVPGAMLAHEGAIAKRSQTVALVERQSQRTRMAAHREVGFYGPCDQLGSLRLHAIIHVLPVI